MIPLANTRVSSMRKTDNTSEDRYGDGYDIPNSNPHLAVATSVRAVISSRGGRQLAMGKNQEIQYVMVSDPMDLTHKDLVLDETTGLTYEVQWVSQNPGIMGLANTEAGLIRSSTSAFTGD